MSKRAGAFVAVVLLVTVLMFMAVGALPKNDAASSDPEGPAFEARAIIADEFTATAHSIPFIVEARGDDVLSKEVLFEFWQNEEVYRSSEIYAEYRFVSFDVELNRPSYGIYTVADGVQGVLVGSFNTTMEQASPDMVKVALHFFVESSPGILGTFSKDNSSEVRTITVGPMVFEDVRVWRAKAFINSVLLDYELTQEAFPKALDLEEVNLDVFAMLSGEERAFRSYGIALDLNTEIGKEAQTSVVLVFVAVIAILIIVFVSLRSAAETLLTGMMILFMLFWIFGSVRLLGLGSSDFIDLLLPIAILSLGVDYAIHSLHRYHEEKRAGKAPRDALRSSTMMVGPALFIAMVTTAVAFFSNASSGLQTVREFGIAAGLAIVFAFLLLGLALPAMRMVIQERRLGRRAAKTAKGGKEGQAAEVAGPVDDERAAREPSRIWRALAKVGTRPILVIVLVILITLPLGYRGMQIEGRMPVEDYINSKSDFVIGLETMNKYFRTGESGMVLFQADFSDPENLEALDTFSENIRDNEEAIPANWGLTISSVVRNMTMNDDVFPMYGNTTLRDHLDLTDDDGNGLPDTPAQIERVYEFIIEQDQGVPLYMVEDRVARHQRLVIESIFHWNKGPELDKTIMVVQLPHSGDASKVAEGREELKSDLAFLDGMGFGYNKVTDGEYYIITDVGTYNPFTREEQMSALTDSMAKSVLISIVLCLVVMVVMFRSLKFGVASILPMVLVVAWLYGVMELTGHYLNSVTVTIAAISIGVGVDYAVHVTHRFREEHGKDGNFEAAMTRTLASTGNALTFSAGSTFVGFLIIAFSPMTMFSKFGYLTALMIGMAFLASVVVLPAFLALAVRNTSRGDEEGEGKGPPPED